MEKIFIAVFCDASTDSGIIENECIYIMFCDPDTFVPRHYVLWSWYVWTTALCFVILIRLNHCIMFCDPDTFEPLHYVLWPWYVWRVVTFLFLKDLPSQYADEIKNTADAALNLFNYIYVTVANSIVFFDSDGASVNSGFKKGLAVTLWEAVVPWLVFVWCLSHQLELTLKDSLDEIMRHIKSG